MTDMNNPSEEEQDGETRTGVEDGAGGGAPAWQGAEEQPVRARRRPEAGPALAQAVLAPRQPALPAESALRAWRLSADARAASGPPAGHPAPMGLPPQARVKLAEASREAQIRALAVGQVWWLPKEHVDYAKPEKDRYCLVVALEPKGAEVPARAHLVAGTTKGATGPALAVAAGEVGTGEETDFDFDRSFPVETRVLIKVGKAKGELKNERLDELKRKIQVSTLVAVQRLAL
jgi:hypothetical protein